MDYAYIDTHCHLTSDKYAGDLDEVIARAQSKGVAMLSVGTDAATSRRCVELAERHDGIWAGVGVHPNDVARLTREDWDGIRALARRPKVAAIGETGLDYYWKDTSPEEQKIWFRRHIELALETGKPLSVHARNSAADVLAELSPWLARGVKAVWHCFTAGRKEMDAALGGAVEHGLYLGIGGLATFEDQKALRAAAGKIPGELLLLETDAPYLIPRPREMSRNEPWGVVRVAEALGELRGTTSAEIAARTTANARRLFAIA